MKPVIKVLVIGGALVVLAILAFNSHQDEVNHLDLKAKLAQLHAEYVERASYTYALGDTDRWRDELASQTRWYQAQIDNISNQHPGMYHQDGPLKLALDAAKKAGVISQDQAALREHYYKMAKSFYDLLEDGQYRPISSSTMYGVRFDLLGIKRVKQGTQDRLRIDMAVWGAPRHESIATENGQATSGKMILDLSFNALDAQYVGTNAKGKKDQYLGHQGGPGGPESLLDYPDGWIRQFPPQAAYAVWYIDPMPANAQTATLEIDGEIKSQTGDPPLPFAIKSQLDVQPDWRVQGAEIFTGQAEVMSAKELDRSQKK